MAFMKWAGLEQLDDTPTIISVPSCESSKEERMSFTSDTVGKFVEEYVLTEFDVEKRQREEDENRRKAQAQRNSSHQFQNGNYSI